MIESPRDRADRLLVIGLLAGLTLGDDLRYPDGVPIEDPHCRFLTIPGEPKPWQRAFVDTRHARPRFLKDHRSAAAAAAVTRSFLAIGPRPFSMGNLALVCVFYRSDRRILDLDNLEKLVMDAGTKAGLWIDDSQITAKLSKLELDADAPRTVIGIARTTSTLDRTIRLGRRRASPKGARP